MERWERIESLFEEALKLGPSERDAFLREACVADLQLFQEVSSLISNDSDSGHLGTSWAATAAAELIASGTCPAPAQHVWTDLSGTTVGPYTIGDLIGVGAMGQVYRAHDGRLRRDVAIKVLPIEMPNQEFEVQRFQREARALGSLNHPNIAAIYDVVEGDSAAFLVLEYVEGVNLAMRLRDGPLPVTEVLSVAAQMADALAAAHAAGIVHRDLKPANITLTPGGRVKVLDFGVSRTIDSIDGNNTASFPSDTARHTTLIAGTPAYMSPEQARGWTVDGRADLWAYGCVVYELLTGCRAFPSQPIEQPESIDAEPDWDLVPSDAPAGLIDVVRACLKRDVQCRLPDSRELQRAIAAIVTRTVKSPPSVTVRPHEPNLRAYEALRKAEDNQHRVPPDAPETAGTLIEDYLVQAIALDPQWAAPHSALAHLYLSWGGAGSQLMIARAREEARKALGLFPSDALAHAVLGAIAALHEYDWRTAEDRFALATAAEPIAASVRHLYAGFYLAPLGRFDDALRQMEQAIAEDPLNMRCRGRYLGILLRAEKYDRAIVEARKQLEFDERHIAAHSMMAMAFFFQGRRDQARVWAEEAVRCTPLNPLAMGMLAALLKEGGEEERTRELLTRLRTLPLELGTILYHVASSEIDAAIDRLEHAIEQRQALAVEWTSAGFLRPLRESPRWHKLTRMMNLPETGRFMA